MPFYEKGQNDDKIKNYSCFCSYTHYTARKAKLAYISLETQKSTIETDNFYRTVILYSY